MGKVCFAPYSSRARFLKLGNGLLSQPKGKKGRGHRREWRCLSETELANTMDQRPHQETGPVEVRSVWIQTPLAPKAGKKCLDLRELEDGLCKKKLFCSNIVDLQCCVNFWCTAKWFSYTHTHTHTHTHILFHILFHCGLSQDIEYSSLCYIVGPCCLSEDGVIASTVQSEETSHLCYINEEDLDFPGGTVVKNLPANAGDTGLIPGLGRSHMPWSN